MMQNRTTPQAGVAPGTMILTASGERPIEALAPGQMLVTVSGRGAPLKPIRALPRAAGPAIRLRAGALGPMLPLRDLLLGAGQWLRCEAMLLPAGLLAGASGGILAEPEAALIAIELEAHDLVVGEGTPLAALPLPHPASPPEPGLLAALRASLARRATLGAAPHPAAAALDRLIGMPEPPHG
jgi:hypothetical protein